MKDKLCNKPKGNEAPSIPNKGVTTGVTDTYGANLSRGDSGRKTFSVSNEKRNPNHK